MQQDFRYGMQLDFSDPVEDQYFMLHCIPRDTARQKLKDLQISVQPYTEVSMDTDGIGNHMVYGLIKQAHCSFSLTASGRVEITDSLYEEYEDPSSVSIHRYIAQTPFTQPGPQLESVYAKLSAAAPEDPYGRMLYYSRCVSDQLEYVRGSTDVHTTAEDAVRLGKGVCQDFAHVLISLLRTSGLPARYAAGIMTGEGESHAWAEVYCRGYWYGIDPTNRLLVDQNYIKFTHGRDYEECMVSRGIFRNPRAVQTMSISVSVRDHEASQ